MGPPVSMQTFLPSPLFALSAYVLDRQRLGKQRVEAWQLLQAIEGHTKGWANHPAAEMWRHHPHALCRYGMAMCAEWIRRGYADRMLPRFEDIEASLMNRSGTPGWMGHAEFHLCHRRTLLSKDFYHYSKQGWTEPRHLYLWPKWNPDLNRWDLWTVVDGVRALHSHIANAPLTLGQ